MRGANGSNTFMVASSVRNCFSPHLSLPDEVGHSKRRESVVEAITIEVLLLVLYSLSSVLFQRPFWGIRKRWISGWGSLVVVDRGCLGGFHVDVRWFRLWTDGCWCNRREWHTLGLGVFAELLGCGDELTLALGWRSRCGLRPTRFDGIMDRLVVATGVVLSLG